MEKYEIIGKRISEIRKELGYSQNNIAKYLNVDQSLVSMIEKGKRSLTVEMLNKLSYLFGLPTQAFVDDDWNSKKLSIAFRANELTEMDMEAISAINRIALNCEFMQNIIDRR